MTFTPGNWKIASNSKSSFKKVRTVGTLSEQVKTQLMAPFDVPILNLLTSAYVVLNIIGKYLNF